MCGRFTLYTDPQKVRTQFNLNENLNFLPSYNLAPSQQILVICELPDHNRVATQMRWGLIPFWLKANENIPPNLINARLDTIDQKPAFKNSFLHRRCLIIADGYYEWKNVEGTKQPYYFQLENKEPFAFAAIWNRWVGDGSTIDSCAIITDEAISNKDIHDRMPMIVNPKLYAEWLDINNTNIPRLKYIAKNSLSIHLQAYPVNMKMNKPIFNSPACIEKI